MRSFRSKNRPRCRDVRLFSARDVRTAVSTYVLNKLKIHGAGDIGCYTLGAVAPLSVVDTTVCMGASISTLHGMEKAKGKDYIKNWVAVIGDSTFLHTGVNSLMNMMYNKATGTVIILDNSTTGMTGHQDHAATGKTLQGDPTYAIDIPGLCRALGVKHVQEINALDIDTLEKAIKEEVARGRGVCHYHKDALRASVQGEEASLRGSCGQM